MPSGQKTVLVVDDNTPVREFAAFCLSEAQFKVLQADCAEAALRIYDHHRDEIDLVLTDMVMPGLFGDQLALLLWELRPNLPIVFMSGNPPQTLEPGLTLESGKNFLRKPFVLRELLEIIRGNLIATS